jgi:hypothetical protein
MERQHQLTLRKASRSRSTLEKACDTPGKDFADQTSLRAERRDLQHDLSIGATTSDMLEGFGFELDEASRKHNVMFGEAIEV